MRAILVSVDYGDLLSVTLPYNRSHFTDVMVVTHPSDAHTISVAQENDCSIYTTTLFYDNGADFNKWAALEAALDVYGRYGWLCIMDADIMWPRNIPSFSPIIGNLYVPCRHWCKEPHLGIPLEPWSNLTLSSIREEFAGYSQIFHCSDPVLPTPPWHRTDWRHAGGADSYFHMRWPRSNKIRPPFNVLHLGPRGTNWCGRASTYLNGTVPPDSQHKINKLHNYIQQRKGKSHGSRHSHEFL